MRTRNLPLLAGGLLLFLLLVLAVVGPILAPRDPLQADQVQRVNGEWLRPPYPPFTVPGFPLGSDLQGRDLLSRLLWGVRPTAVLLLIAAALRLSIGTAVGVAAGWASGRAGRFCEAAISLALSVPAIVVALAAITAIGIQKGLPAFLFGLCLTGWAETARVVSEQTRSLKQQPFVEAARAMGATGLEIVVRHVWRHVSPVLGMLLAFEASATLMTIAALGLLGYYLGGAFWVEVADFRQQAISGLPELGQMLAESWQMFKPWPTFATGTVVFFAILGFNLLGEGLRRRTMLAGSPRQSQLPATLGRAGSWLDETLLVPSGDARSRRRRLATASIILGAVVITLAWQPWLSRVLTPHSQGAIQAPPVTGGHLWGQERRDAYGTAAAQIESPPGPSVAWSFAEGSGFVGGPVVDRDGNIYVASKAAKLYSFDPSGKVRWISDLPATPAGTPALGPADANDGQGAIYVTDEPGGVSAYLLDGGHLWRTPGQAKRRATSGPVVGPDGVVYYSAVDRVEAVNPDGTPRWTSGRLAGSGDAGPVLSPDGHTLFEVDSALDVATGKLLDYSAVATPGKAGVNAQYMIGGDGQTYLRYAHAILSWQTGNDGPRITGKRDWTYQTSTVYEPFDSGVSTLGTGVLIYGSQYDDLRVVQLSAGGRLLTNLHWPQRSPRLVATDLADRAYVCGDSSGGVPECIGVLPGENSKPGWLIQLNGGSGFAGAALVPGRLYVTTRDGWLYAVGE